MPVDNKKILFADVSEARAGLYSVPKVVHENNTLASKKSFRESTVRLINRTLYLKTPNASIRPEQRTAVRYERHSIQQAVTNRYEHAEAITASGSDSAAFLFRLYGRFGLNINICLRRNPNPYPNPRLSYEQMSRQRVAENMRIFSQSMGINSIDDIHDTKKVLTQTVHNELSIYDGYDISLAIGVWLNEIIKDHQINFKNSDNTLLYRVSRAKKDTFNLESKVSIKVGDTIADKAFTSTGSDMESIIYRYSSHELAATHGRGEKTLDPSEEEVIFVIEANRHLEAANISGFKAPRMKDKLSSGEVLVQSSQLFKVAAIAPKTRNERSRVVFLEPLKNPYTPHQIYRNPFDGSAVMADELFAP